MSIKELKKRARELDLDITGITEKAELVAEVDRAEKKAKLGRNEFLVDPSSLHASIRYEYYGGEVVEDYTLERFGYYEDEKVKFDDYEVIYVGNKLVVQGEEVQPDDEGRVTALKVKKALEDAATDDTRGPGPGGFSILQGLERKADGVYGACWGYAMSWA